jgi:thiol-disulfide isomerase/thioredoxin
METVNIVWIIIGICVLASISYGFYTNFIKIDKKQFVPNEEYVPANKRYECKLFYTTWCPHCKKTLKEWESYKNTRPEIVFTIVDCDKEKDQAELYQIDSYPTILMVVEDKKYIFDSNFSKDSMDKFVNTILKL